MTFNYYKCVNLVISAIQEITGLPDKQVFYSGASNNLPDYPYMAYNIPSPHHMEERSPDYTHEVFESTLNCNFYDKNSPEFPINACDELHYMLRDPVYRDEFDANGVTIAAVSDNGANNADIANANDIYSQNLQIKLRFSIYHNSSIYNIQRTNLN